MESLSLLFAFAVTNNPRLCNHMALPEGFYGNGSAAKRDADAALQLSKSREGEYSAAVAPAISGNFARAQVLAADWGKRFGEDTSVRYIYLPVLRALFALHDGKPGYLGCCAEAVPDRSC